MMPRCFRSTYAASAAITLGLAGCQEVQKVEPTDREAAWREQTSWRNQESGILANHVRLTSPDRFSKGAGEAYLSPDGKRVIFQAFEQPKGGGEPEKYYSMYVATVDWARGGVVKGLQDIQRISPPGSSNTCGWFDGADPDRVIFASTITAPASGQTPGYQRGSRDYRWQFPPEMDIYACRLSTANGSASSLTPLLKNPNAYLAECSLTPDGRHLLYCSMESGGGDIYVRDLKSGTSALLVGAPGYDGGPFFSPDARRICYRSDRRGDDLLQVYVADLVYDRSGKITGITGETQLTRNRSVNFAPFWHPDGRHLVYTSSEPGHNNYELFMIEAVPGGPGKKRLTNASGFDGFPVFSRDGKKLLWTSQREGGSSQVWIADFVLDMGTAGR